LTVTYSEVLDATSFCSTWNNSGNQTINGNNVVDTLIADGGANDVLTVADVGANCGGPTNFAFGSVNLQANYVSANTLFQGLQGRLRWTPGARTLQIRLATGIGSESSVGLSTPIYTPSTALRDQAGNTMTATPFSAPATSRF
jgi:hypothetical protein